MIAFSHYHIIILSLPYHLIFILPWHHAMIKWYRIVILACHHIIMLSYYHIIIWSYYHNIMLSYYRNITVSCYHFIVLSDWMWLVLHVPYLTASKPPSGLGGWREAQTIRRAAVGSRRRVESQAVSTCISCMSQFWTCKLHVLTWL